jgi:hypothetical protein
VAPVASAPSRIITGASESKLAMGESEVDVAPESAVLVSGNDERGILVVVDHGTVECDVAPRKGRPPFVVEAGEVRVKVVGTHFSVARDAQGQGAHVLVAHGIVEVSSRGETVTLHDGEAWPSLKTASSSPPSDLGAQAPVTVAKTDAPTTGRFGVRPPRFSRPHGAGAKIARTLPDLDPAPVVATPGAASPVGAAPAPSSPLAAPPTSPVTAPPPSAPPPREPSSQEPSAQQLYEAAAHIEGQDPEAALGMYRRVASGSGAWAANALYAAGRLQSDRGRKAEAQRLLSDYLARYPNGPNARDARDLLSHLR